MIQMKLNRTLILTLTLVVCASVALGGTIAYYTAQAVNVNTFDVTTGIQIALDEAKVEKVGDEYVAVTPEERVKENNYQDLYPGAVMPKDPTVTILPGSDAAYIRAAVTVSGAKNWLHLYGAETVDGNFMLLINNKLGEGWSLTGYEEVTEGENAGDYIFNLLYANRLNAGEKTAPIFEHVVFTADVDETTLPLFGGQFKITVVAEAVQAAGFESVQEAFAAIEENP